MPEASVIEATVDQRRRRFLVSAIYALPAVMGGMLAASVGTYLFGKPKTQADGWADAGDLSSLSKDQPNQILFARNVADGWKDYTEKADAWVVLDEHQKVTAFSPLCTHLGCAYRWEPKATAFSCPCHGSAFNVRGEVLRGPAARPLDRYAVKVEGTRLWLGPIEDSQTT